jgi:hypothetical protein
MTTSEIPAVGPPPDAPPLSERLAEWRSVALGRGYAFWNECAPTFFSGLLFREGEDVTVNAVIDASNSSSPYFAGSVSGRYGAAGVAVTTAFVAIPLARSMPSIVLVNARQGALREAQIGMGSRQMLSLEGDFDRAFTLYCPLGHDAQALAVFTPAMMQLFLDSAPASDVEIVDEWMFIYVRADGFLPEEALVRVERVVGHVHETIVTREAPPVEVPTESFASRRVVPVFVGVQLLAVGSFAVLVAVAIAMTVGGG